MNFTPLALTPGTAATASDALLDPTLAALRGRASADPKAAVREAAKQFESLFMRELIKSMREATHEVGPARQRRREARHRPARPAVRGADVRHARRPGRRDRAPADAADDRRRGRRGVASAGAAPAPVGAAVAGRRRAGRLPAAAAPAAGFVQRTATRPPAWRRPTGIPAAFMLGQAGARDRLGPARDPQCRRQQRRSTCSASRPAPAGPARCAEITTTEYVDGEPRKVTREVPRLRLLRGIVPRLRPADRSESPRYAQALRQTGSAPRPTRPSCSAPATRPTRPTPPS